MSRLFIAGSGTGVGKTLVTCLLTRELRAAGCRVRALKPLETGFDPGQPQLSDGAQLLQAMGLAPSDFHLRRVTGWQFTQPLSPDMAAAREGRRIPFSELVEFCDDTPGEISLIEGVGGVMVPLDDTHTVLDWISALAAPVVLVTGSYLGSLSHTLTAVTALKTRSVRLAAVIVSESPEQPVPLSETAATLRRFITDTTIIPLPRLTEKKAGAIEAPEMLPLMDGLRGTIAAAQQADGIQLR